MVIIVVIPVVASHPLGRIHHVSHIESMGRVGKQQTDHHSNSAELRYMVFHWTGSSINFN
jgi:hypothetical protein